jgi:hypothetical protein
MRTWMDSQAMPSRGAASSQMISALQRPGWLTFAAVVMFAIGVERVIASIYYFADSARVADLNLGAFGGHLFLWGIVELVIAVLAFWGGSSLLRGDTFGRVIGYIWAIVVIVENFISINVSPWSSAASLVIAVLVIYALSTTSGWREPAAEPAAEPASGATP